MKYVCISYVKAFAIALNVGKAFLFQHLFNDDEEGTIKFL